MKDELEEEYELELEFELEFKLEFKLELEEEEKLEEEDVFNFKVDLDFDICVFDFIIRVDNKEFEYFFKLKIENINSEKIMN